MASDPDTQKQFLLDAAQVAAHIGERAEALATEAESYRREGARIAAEITRLQAALRAVDLKRAEAEGRAAEAVHWLNMVRGAAPAGPPEGTGGQGAQE